MVCAIMQPTYFPWLGYFHLMYEVDNFVYLDDVQLAKRSWQVRNRIKNEDRELFITVPIRKTRHRDELLIKDAVIDQTVNWVDKHLKSIEHSYKKCPFFDDNYVWIVEVLTKKHEYLADLNIEIINKIKEILGVGAKTIRSSELAGITGFKENRLASICNAIECDEYISPRGSESYLGDSDETGVLQKNGIKLDYHDYVPPMYSQSGANFISHLSIIDALFNVGWSEVSAMIKNDNWSHL